MIERFNFYDIYGYLLPGLTLLTLLWLPFGLVAKEWPTAQFLSALVALAFGYVIGHVLQILAKIAFPSTSKDRTGKDRYPSYILLEDNDQTLSPELKKRIADMIQSRFGIDVSDAGNSDLGIRDRRRQDAFLLCRTTLIQKGIAAYAEQFQGMYVFMRGLTAAFGLASTYDLGWVLVGIVQPCFESRFLYILVGLTIILFVAAIVAKKGPYWWVAALLLLIGIQFGWGKEINLEAWLFLLAIFLTSLFVSRKAYGAYQSLAKTFASTVYRDFSVT